MPRDDVFDSFEPTLRASPETNPWEPLSRTMVRYRSNVELLARLVSLPVGEGRGAESGRFAKAIDAWVAHELRRAGFPPDEVWPRRSQPRVLPREVGILLEQLPKGLQAQVRDQLLRARAVAPSDAWVLGRAYVKQVDVLIAQWARGPELLVSTKSMVSSFRNNLANRFEESYGDAKNLRGRYPLASMGFLFVFRSTILQEPGTFEKALDMLRKLRAEHDVSDATSAIVLDWSDPGGGAEGFAGVTVREDVVPDDLSVDQFMTTIIDAVLDRTPIDMHVDVRERREHRDLPLEEADENS